MSAAGFCRDLHAVEEVPRVRVERVVLLDAALRVDVDLAARPAADSEPRPPPRPAAAPPPGPRRAAAGARPAAAPPRRGVMPPAVGGGGGPCLRCVRGTVGRTAQPMRFTCSEPRLPTKNTPQPSMSSCARATSPLANVIEELVVLPRRSRTCRAPVRDPRRAPRGTTPTAAVLIGTLVSAFMNQWATST